MLPFDPIPAPGRPPAAHAPRLSSSRLPPGFHQKPFAPAPHRAMDRDPRGPRGCTAFAANVTRGAETDVTDPGGRAWGPAGTAPPSCSFPTPAPGSEDRPVCLSLPEGGWPHSAEDTMSTTTTKHREWFR